MKIIKQWIVVFVIIILIVITLYNYVRINSNNSDDKNKSQLLNQRLASLSLVLGKSGEAIKDIVLTNAVKQINETVSFKEPTLVILLSNLGCSKCQNRELKNIKKYCDEISSSKIKIIAICNSTDRETILKLKKITQVNIPLYLGNVAGFIEEYKIDDIFPQYFFTFNNRVIYSFLPIAEDDKFSDWFFSLLKTNNKSYSK